MSALEEPRCTYVCGCCFPIRLYLFLRCLLGTYSNIHFIVLKFLLVSADNKSLISEIRQDWLLGYAIVAAIAHILGLVGTIFQKIRTLHGFRVFIYMLFFVGLLRFILRGRHGMLDAMDFEIRMNYPDLRNTYAVATSLFILSTLFFLTDFGLMVYLSKNLIQLTEYQKNPVFAIRPKRETQTGYLPPPLRPPHVPVPEQHPRTSPKLQLSSGPRRDSQTFHGSPFQAGSARDLHEQYKIRDDRGAHNDNNAALRPRRSERETMDPTYYSRDVYPSLKPFGPRGSQYGMLSRGGRE